jgi:hypothetical protein
MADFYDATHLLSAVPSDEERRLGKQLTFFLSRTVAPPHRPALLGKPPAVAWALLQALKPQTGHSLEDLVQQGDELRLTDHGPTSYATEHRLVQRKIFQRQADHHYATPQAYLNRVLKGMDDHPTCGPRSGRFLTPLSQMWNICFANSMIFALSLRFPLQMRPRPTTAVAVALPGILDPPGTPQLQITSAHFVRLTIITPEIAAARTGPALDQTVPLAP